MTITSVDARDRDAVTDAELHPLLAQRWSARGFDAGHALGDAELSALLEAARWAPSAANTQPWRFVVARRGESVYERLVALLAPGNVLWAPVASALILVAAATQDDEGQPQPWARYDVGQAAAHLTVQATALGLTVHQMGGFDAAGAASEFGLPEGVEPQAVIAVGRLDPDAVLPEALAAREVAPRSRRPLADLLLAGDLV
jgi:nitroreductase